MTRKAIRVEPLSSFLEARKLRVSPVVSCGGLVFVSGFPPFSKSGTIEPETVERQTEIALDRMLLCLKAAGSSLQNVLKCNVYADDPKHFDIINRVYERYFEHGPPARIFLVVPAWFGPFNMEIDCIAAADQLHSIGGERRS